MKSYILEEENVKAVVDEFFYLMKLDENSELNRVMEQMNELSNKNIDFSSISNFKRAK